MDKRIVIEVNGSYIRKDSDVAGVQGEANVTIMNIIFDESWSGYAKRVTFWDARGENPVKRTLTTDLLTDITVSTLDYSVPIPGEPLVHEGRMEFVIEGYIDGVRKRTLSDKLKVKPSPMEINADEPADPTPDQAEQLQQQIDTMLGDMQSERIQAQEAKETAVKAAEEAVTSRNATEVLEASASARANEAITAAKTAVEARNNTEENAQKAQYAATSAASSAQSASESASSASTSADSASRSATQAEEYARSAGISASDAKASEENASQSALTALTAKENASNSEAKASTSEANAKASEEAAIKAAESAVSDAKQMLVGYVDDAETAKVAAEEAQRLAEKARDEAGSIVGGDFATRDEARGYANQAEENAKEYTDQQIAQIPTPDVSGQIEEHNQDEEAHPYIQELIETLGTRLNAIANSTDEELDQIAELVAYIKDNRSLIEQITTGKVSVSDIVNSLTSSATDKPLSAAQGKVLKDLVDDHAEAITNLGTAVEVNTTAIGQKASQADLNNLSNEVEAGLAGVDSKIADKAPMYTYGTEDLEAGVTPLETGRLHFVYE